MPAWRRPFLRWCWVPPALWAAVLWYVPRSGDTIGTGLVMALTVPVLLSVTGLVLGIVLVAQVGRRTGRVDVLGAVATILASTPILSILLSRAAR